MGEQDATAEAAPPESSGPNRFVSFARYFKTYMGLAAVVTAALPIPIATFETIPAYSQQRAELATFASLLCFLVLAYVFYMRHTIASVLFLHRHERLRMSRMIEVLPVVLIIGVVVNIFSYQLVLIHSVNSAVLKEVEYRTNGVRAPYC